MKTISKTKTAPKNDAVGCSVHGQKPIDIITKEFVAAEIASAKKKENGRENYINDMAGVIVPFVATYQNATHSVNEFASFCRHLDLPFFVIENFYSDFIAALRAERRVRQIETCYEGTQYVFC